MASPVGPPVPQQHGACSSRDDGLRVLNAASHLVLERTLVEAFVKLVVCRKVTVQRVVAASGQVLDSHTTQEEDVPVILDVHRHEVGGDCSSSRWSPGLPFAMDLPDHPPSPSPSQRNSERRHQMSSGGRDRHRKGPSPEPLQRPSELEGSACGDGESERGLHRNHGPVNHPTAMCGYGKYRERTEERDKDKPVKADVHLHTNSVCKKRGKSDGDVHLHTNSVCKKRGKSDGGSDVTMHASRGSTELKSNDASAGSASDDFIEMGGSERTDRRKQCERLIAKNLNSPQHKESREDPASTSEKKDSSTQDLKEAMDEQDSLPCGEDGELMEDASAELNEESEQGLHGGMESREDPQKWTEHSSDGVDDLEQDVEMALDGDAAATPDLKWKGESVAMQSALEEQLTLHTSHCKSPSVGREDTKDQGLRVTKGNLGNSNEEKEVSFDLGDGSLNIDTTADQHSEVKREASGDEMGSGNSQLEQCSQPSEYDTEQDMLVIDISNTVLEQIHQNTNTEQTHPTTDNEQTSPNTDGETMHSTTESKETHPDANSEKIDQNVYIDSQSHHIADHCTSSSAWEQRTSEKPDPFFHLLTNFPVMDRSRSKESHPKGKAKQRRSRMTSDSSAIRSTSHPIKEELDDDCMITAAFMSPPTRENRGQQQKPVSHTVTRESRVVEQRPGMSSQSLAVSAVPGRVWRGGMSPRQRSTAGQWAQYFPSASSASALLPGQQFQQSVQGFQANPSMVAVAAAAGTSAAGYQARASSLRAESSIPAAPLPPVSQGYVPNFLSTASSSEVSDCVDSGAVPGAVSSALEDSSGMPVTDLSLTFQCPLCSKIFMHQHKFSRHLAMCGGCRPFKCKICSKAFNQRAHLDTHMKFHRGIKRYKCDVCQKAYVMKGDLIRHLKTRSHNMVLQSYGLPVQ